jgi:hypothetical protein
MRVTLKNMTRVLPWAAKSRNFSPGGMAIRPSARVMITVWEPPGTVNSTFKRAAAAKAELTPGIIS